QRTGEADVELDGARLRERPRPGVRLEAEAPRAVEHLQPDGPEAGDADALAEQALGGGVPRLLPAAGAEVGRGVGDAAVEREDEAHRQLGDGDRVLARAVGDVDAARA